MKIRTALEKAGIEFIENGGGPSKVGCFALWRPCA